MNFSQAEDTRSTPSPVNIGLGVGDIENDELITSLHSSRLSNMMSMSKNALPHEKYRSRVANIEDGVTAIKNRISAVAWIKEVSDVLYLRLNSLLFTNLQISLNAS